MDSIKDWLTRLGLQEFGPSAIRGAILGLAGWLLMKNDALTSFGVISDSATHTTTIHWDQLSTATITALPALLAAGIKFFQYHMTKSVSQPVVPAEKGA